MIHLRATFAPLLLALSTLGRVAAAQTAPEPAPPLPLAPPAVYNPPAPPPYTGPSMMGTWDKSRFHDRFYLRLSVGGGTMGTNADFKPNNGIDFETQGGAFAFDVAIGGTPAPGFVIGGDFAFQEAFRPHFTVNNFQEGESNANTVFGLLGFFVDWFPDPRGGFHVGGTFGYADLSVAGENNVIVNDVKERGVGGAVRLGYDIWISNQWSLGLLGQWVGGWVTGDNGDNNSVTESDTVSSFALLFTALYH